MGEILGNANAPQVGTRRAPWLRHVSCCHTLAGALFVIAGVGCHGSVMTVSGADGGAGDVTSSLDVVGLDSAPAGPDTRDAVVTQDVFLPGPDSFPARPEASDLRGQSAPDARGAPADASGDLSTAGVPPLPKDVVILTNENLGPADAQCIAATPGWVNMVSTFLAEDQKCWADTDCTYVSFSDSCGMICVLPMNQQRIGEFGTQVYGYASENCSSCPSPASYPACSAPRAVFCNAGRCEYKAN